MLNLSHEIAPIVVTGVNVLPEGGERDRQIVKIISIYRKIFPHDNPPVDHFSSLKEIFSLMISQIFQVLPDLPNPLYHRTCIPTMSHLINHGTLGMDFEDLSQLKDHIIATWLPYWVNLIQKDTLKKMDKFGAPETFCASLRAIVQCEVMGADQIKPIIQWVMHLFLEQNTVFTTKFVNSDKRYASKNNS